MRVLTNLLFKVTLSSMVLTAPAMITGRAKYDGDSRLKAKAAVLPFYSSAVIVKFIEHPSLTVVPTYTVEEKVAGVRACSRKHCGSTGSRILRDCIDFRVHRDSAVSGNRSCSSRGKHGSFRNTWYCRKCCSGVYTTKTPAAQRLQPLQTRSPQIYQPPEKKKHSIMGSLPVQQQRLPNSGW